MPCLRSSWASARRARPLSDCLRADEHLGVRLVVDEADLGHPVEHLRRHVVVAAALAQLLLELGTAARRHAQLSQDDRAGHRLGVGLGDGRLGVLRRRRPVGPLPRVVGTPARARLARPRAHDGRSRRIADRPGRSPPRDPADEPAARPVGPGHACARGPPALMPGRLGADGHGPRQPDPTASARPPAPPTCLPSLARRTAGPHPGDALGLSQGGRGASQTVPCGLLFGETHDQKSTGTSETSAGWSTRGPTPSFSLTFFSISSARSGLSLRKLRAFSLPWPSWSPS